MRRRAMGLVRLLVVSALGGIGFAEAPAEDWFRVESSDGRASVLFPNRAEDVQELVDKTPGGSVVTRVAKYEGDGLLMSISESELPGLAVAFAGSKLILKNSKGSVLRSALGREISSERIKVDGADAAMVMRYESVDYDDKDHPGYSGQAVFVIVGKYVYVINSMITKETPGNRSMQEKLLRSVRVYE